MSKTTIKNTKIGDDGRNAIREYQDKIRFYEQQIERKQYLESLSLATVICLQNCSEHQGVELDREMLEELILKQVDCPPNEAINEAIASREIAIDPDGRIFLTPRVEREYFNV